MSDIEDTPPPGAPLNSPASENGNASDGSHLRLLAKKRRVILFASIGLTTVVIWLLATLHRASSPPDLGTIGVVDRLLSDLFLPAFYFLLTAVIETVGLSYQFVSKRAAIQVASLPRPADGSADTTSKQVTESPWKFLLSPLILALICVLTLLSLFNCQLTSEPLF